VERHTPGSRTFDSLITYPFQTSYRTPSHIIIPRLSLETEHWWLRRIASVQFQATTPLTLRVIRYCSWAVLLDLMPVKHDFLFTLDVMHACITSVPKCLYQPAEFVDFAAVKIEAERCDVPPRFLNASCARLTVNT